MPDTASEPRAVHFSDLAWIEDAPRIESRAVEVDGARWAVVRYAPGAARTESCLDGHRGYVVEGHIAYELAGGGRLDAKKGSAFWLPPGIAHRGINGDEETVLFLVDVPFDGEDPSRA